MRAHAPELVQVLKTLLKNGLAHRRSARRHAQKRRHGLLQIGGKTGIYLRFYVDRPLFALGPDADGIVVFGYAHAHFQQLGRQRFHVRGNAAVDGHVAAGGGGGDHEGAGFDLVGNNGVGGAVQMLHAPDADDVGAGALDARAHAVEEVGQVHDVGLLGHVVHHRGAFGAHGGQHDVDGAAHGDKIKKHIAPGEALGVGVHHAAPVVNARAQGRKALEVLVDEAAPNVAPAGIGNLGPQPAAQQRPQHIVAGAQPLGQRIGHPKRMDAPGIHGEVFAGHIVHLGAQRLQNLVEGVHVVNVGQVFHRTGLVAQKGCGYGGHRCVFAAAHGDFPHQGPASGDEHFVLHVHKPGRKGRDHLAL